MQNDQKKCVLIESSELEVERQDKYGFKFRKGLELILLA